MKETLLEHYVISGGWTMLVLIPAMMVALATIIRGAMMLRRDRLVGDDSASEKIARRLSELHDRVGAVSAEDMRAEISAELLAIFATFQMLQIVFALTPVIGLIGTVTAMMAAQTDAAASGNVQLLAAQMERALIPTLWGLVIGVISYIGFAWLRSRLYRFERTVITPAVESSVAALNKSAAALGLRKGIA